jgi:xanthine dehydrogenase YagS FAD-binding subunit
MHPFAYARASTFDDAIAAAREPGTVVLAGGTELLNWLRLGIAAPDRVVDISHVAGLDRIEPLPGGGLRIGAIARLNHVAAHPDVALDRPSDPAVALAALDAHVVTRSAGGTRRIAVTYFHVLPADGVDRDTVLGPGELIEAIELGPPAPHSAYVKVRERESYEYGLVSAAAAVELDDGGRIERARIALGSVALRPWRLLEAERRLAGLAPDDPAVTGALDVALAPARPVSGSAYKLAIARGAARRALLTAAGVRP